jgi:hypothetical protein
MTKIPEKVRESMKNADVYVLATSNKEAMPNVVYIGYMRLIDDEHILIADNQMVKTLENIKNNPKAAITFRDDELGSYQIKGGVEYHTDDDYHKQVREWCREDLDRKGAVVLTAEEVYNGAEKLA